MNYPLGIPRSEYLQVVAFANLVHALVLWGERKMIMPDRVEAILWVLESQKFNDWYTSGAFDDYIKEYDETSRIAIRKDIESIFREVIKG